MRLYVWEGAGVLQDWSSGMIVALAPDLETALSVAEDYIRPCMGEIQPEVIELGDISVEPRVWFVYGGG